MKARKEKTRVFSTSEQLINRSFIDDEILKIIDNTKFVFLNPWQELEIWTHKKVSQGWFWCVELKTDYFYTFIQGREIVGEL